MTSYLTADNKYHLHLHKVHFPKQYDGIGNKVNHVRAIVSLYASQLGYNLKDLNSIRPFDAFIFNSWMLSA